MYVVATFHLLFLWNTSYGGGKTTLIIKIEKANTIVIMYFNKHNYDVSNKLQYQI